MCDDPPPPYTARCETKVDPDLQSSSVTTCANFVAPETQTVPVPLVGAGPSAPPIYDTVACYPPTSSGINAPVPMQPQPAQNQAVVVIQAPQVVLVPQQQHPASKTFVAHICASSCSCLCCWACPCSLTAFILARKSRSS